MVRPPYRPAGTVHSGMSWPAFVAWFTWGCTANREAVQPPPLDASSTTSATGLVGLDVSGATLVPPFSADIHAYAVRADEVAAPLDVRAATANPFATTSVRLSTIDDADGTAAVVAQPGAVIEAGDRIEVTVTEVDGSESTTTVVALPSGLPPITEVRGPGAAPSPGATYVGTMNEDTGGAFYALILDENAVPTWWRSYLMPVQDFRRNPLGLLSFVGVNEAVLLDASTREEVGRVGAPDYLGQPIQIDVHEFFQQEDGTLLILGEYALPMDLSPYGGAVDMRIVHHVIQEVDPQGGVQWTWSTDGVVDYTRVPTWTYDPSLDAWDYCHINAVSYDPDDGNLIVSMRILSQVIKVARHPTTLRDRSFAEGEVIWRLGGPDSDFQFDGDDRAGIWRGFAGQHSARMLGDNELIVFDNAQWREAPPKERFQLEAEQMPTGEPRYVSYRVDTDRMVATRLEEHTVLADPIRVAGSVQRLPDGHTLIGWGNLSEDPTYPAITELDATGAVSREITLGDGQWTYRAWQFDREFDP